MHSDAIMYSGKMGRFGMFIFLGLILFLSVPVGTCSAAGPSPEAVKTNGIPEVPAEFGEIVYHLEGSSGAGHLFVIGHSHRSAVTGANGTHTIRAQADAYRIGEWLIQNENVRLLLPEGFFRGKSMTNDPAEELGVPPREAVFLDDQSLSEVLSDTSTFTNADILLKRNFDIFLQQVEDEKIYHAVGSLMRSAMDSKNYELPSTFVTELDFLQEVRTATMLQKASEAIDREYSTGRIMNKKAIFTIGMAHVDEIIRFLREGRIELQSPAQLKGYDNLSAALQLVDEGYGVTVILPRVLFDDRETLKLARLNEI